MQDEDVWQVQLQKEFGKGSTGKNSVKRAAGVTRKKRGSRGRQPPGIKKIISSNTFHRDNGEKALTLSHSFTGQFVLENKLSLHWTEHLDLIYKKILSFFAADKNKIKHKDELLDIFNMRLSYIRTNTISLKHIRDVLHAQIHSNIAYRKFLHFSFYTLSVRVVGIAHST